MICFAGIFLTWIPVRPDENLEQFVKVILESPTISSFIWPSSVDELLSISLH